MYHTRSARYACIGPNANRVLSYLAVIVGWVGQSTPQNEVILVEVHVHAYHDENTSQPWKLECGEIKVVLPEHRG